MIRNTLFPAVGERATTRKNRDSTISNTISNTETKAMSTNFIMFSFTTLRHEKSQVRYLIWRCSLWSSSLFLEEYLSLMEERGPYMTL